MCRRVTFLPELPWASQLLIHFLTNMVNCLCEKQKIGLARKVTPITGSPFCDGRVLSKAHFSPYKRLGSPNWVNRIIGKTIRACMSTVLDNQSVGKCCWFGQRGHLFSHINACYICLGGEDDPFIILSI